MGRTLQYKHTEQLAQRHTYNIYNTYNIYYQHILYIECLDVTTSNVMFEHN